jgi:hypothetical protein
MRLLKEIEVYEEAVEEYNAEIRYFKQLAAKRNDVDRKKGKAGLAFLAYLKSYLKLRDFWLSWSPAGAREAANRLGIPFEKIARTTNHLESFNGRLKSKFFAHHMRAGCLPRLDYWILIFITEALPTFFAEWAEKRALASYYSHMRQAAPTSSTTNVQFQSRSTATSKSTSIPEATPLPPPTLQKPTSVAQAEEQAIQWAERVFSQSAVYDNVPETLTMTTEEFLHDLDADAEAEDSDFDEEDDGTEPEEDALGNELMLSADHNSCVVEDSMNWDQPLSPETNVSLSPDSTTLSSSSSSSVFSDIALDAANIVLNLEQADDSNDSDSDGEAFDLKHIASHKSSPSATLDDPRRTTAMMELQWEEDALVAMLKHLLDLGVKRETLAAHISPSISEQLFNTAPTELVPKAHVPPATPITNRGRSTSSPMILLPARPQLAPLDPQKKHARYQSHGVR